MSSSFSDMFTDAVIAVALLPVLIAFVASANVTGTSGILLDLVPVFYVIVLIIAFARRIKKKK